VPTTSCFSTLRLSTVDFRLAFGLSAFDCRPFDFNNDSISGLRLESDHLRQPAAMALLAGKRRSQEGSHQLPSQLRADHPAAHHQHVHVIVLDALMGGIRVVAEPGADARQLVGGDGSADSAAADQDGALRAAIEY